MPCRIGREEVILFANPGTLEALVLFKRPLPNHLSLGEVEEIQGWARKVRCTKEPATIWRGLHSIYSRRLHRWEANQIVGIEDLNSNVATLRENSVNGDDGSPGRLH